MDVITSDPTNPVLLDVEEARTVSELSGTAAAREGLAAVIERRAPRFTGR